MPTSVTNFFRGVISKKKKRLIDESRVGGAAFNLDLTYITPRIIAMGFPSVGVEASYRNPMHEVQRFFAERHEGVHKVYNLCAERSYDAAAFGATAHYPFDDHNPCAFDILEPLCADALQFLSRNPTNVVAIHCKAGKGRTGLVVSCLLLYLGLKARIAGCPTSAREAIDLFAAKRTDNKKGITIPSQMRYVFYFEAHLRRQQQRQQQPPPPPSPPVPRLMDEDDEPTYQLLAVRLVTVPNSDPAIKGGGCDPYIVVRQLEKLHPTNPRSAACVAAGTPVPRVAVPIFNQMHSAHCKVRKCRRDEPCVDLRLAADAVYVRGDVHVTLYDFDWGEKDDKLAGVWFHTRFITRPFLVFERSVIDHAVKDKHHKIFRPEFRMEIFLQRASSWMFERQQSLHVARDDLTRGRGTAITAAMEREWNEDEYKDDEGTDEDEPASADNGGAHEPVSLDNGGAHHHLRQLKERHPSLEEEGEEEDNDDGAGGDNGGDRGMVPSISAQPALEDIYEARDDDDDDDDDDEALDSSAQSMRCDREGYPIDG